MTLTSMSVTLIHVIMDSVLMLLAHIAAIVILDIQVCYYDKVHLSTDIPDI